MSDLQRLRRYSYQGEGDEIAELVGDIHWAADEIERLEASLLISKKKHELAIERIAKLEAAIADALATYRQPHGLGDSGRLSAMVSILSELEQGHE